jgi:pimeloyl-ACP methyl ester carboxylesterase
MSETPRLEPMIEGTSGGETLFFVQGWPDDHRLWDDMVALLRDRYRCVRVDLPNYGDAERARWGFSHDAIVEGLARCIRQESGGKPVTIVAHDWGAFWTYLLHHRHPELVGRLVALDIGAYMKPTPREIAYIMAYQWWLAAAFIAGGAVGDRMTRAFARLAKTPKQGTELNSRMNYPYLYTWRDIFTGRAGKQLRGYRPKVPLLFIYGEKKPGRFHSDSWLEVVRSRPGNAVVPLPDADHWVTRDPTLKVVVRDWLAESSSAARA